MKAYINDEEMTSRDHFKVAATFWLVIFVVCFAMYQLSPFNKHSYVYHKMHPATPAPVETAAPMTADEFLKEFMEAQGLQTSAPVQEAPSKDEAVEKALRDLVEALDN
jgi:hypothetical protein